MQEGAASLDRLSGPQAQGPQHPWVRVWPGPGSRVAAIGFPGSRDRVPGQPAPERAGDNAVVHLKPVAAMFHVKRLLVSWRATGRQAAPRQAARQSALIVRDAYAGRTTTYRPGSSPSLSLTSPAAATTSCTTFRSNGFIGASETG